MLSIADLINYVRDHASDVADLARLHTIETTADPHLRHVEEKALRAKYEDEAITSQRRADFDEIFS